MGKAKTRILHKGRNDQIPRISREEAIEQAAKYLNIPDIQSASQLITLFGLNAEEILEAGADYEAVVAMGNIFKS